MADKAPYPGPPRWVKVSGIVAIVVVVLIAIVVFAGLGGEHGPGRHGPSDAASSATQASGTAAGLPPETEPVRQRFESYTLEQTEREGYVRDEFCLDAAAFGLPDELGAMGFHATNESLLRGPIESDRPQALMFDADGQVLGVEYEVVTDAVSEPPRLFGQTFEKLPAHAGVEHEHYALHLWFVGNPSGAFADFNPSLSCPRGSTPEHGPGAPGH